jgi:hypothetical protein
MLSHNEKEKGMTTTLREQLVHLFREAGPAHHQAYFQTNGADPDWPLWYADYLYKPLTHLLPIDFTKSELVCLLIQLHKDHEQKAPDRAWYEYYAVFFMERYA